jgi:hypothetical protein
MKNVSRMPPGSAPQKPTSVTPMFPRKSIRSHVAGNDAITAARRMKRKASIRISRRPTRHRGSAPDGAP